MTTTQLKHVSADKFLTAEEAANLLGIKVGAIRNYLSEGRLTTFKFKTLTLLKIEEIKEWRKRQK